MQSPHDCTNQHHVHPCRVSFLVNNNNAVNSAIGVPVPNLALDGGVEGLKTGVKLATPLRVQPLKGNSTNPGCKSFSLPKGVNTWPLNRTTVNRLTGELEVWDSLNANCKRLKVQQLPLTEEHVMVTLIKRDRFVVTIEMQFLPASVGALLVDYCGVLIK